MKKHQQRQYDVHMEILMRLNCNSIGNAARNARQFLRALGVPKKSMRIVCCKRVKT